ncbi:phosphotransferase [Natronohydrobacter thiooxidans]|uniref:phosphotransferase n=1 Tax=Natronohydrobacter thiooxidans TaxID=87172 RepID=UPI0009FCB675|nr:phosphotransferase [Natronohydrobacter thiooxidans]
MNALAAQPWFRSAANNLARRADANETDRTAALLERHYGLTGTIVPLSSEVERTAEIRLPDGRALIFKTATRPEAVESFRFQSNVLASLRGTPGVSVPEVQPTLQGKLMFVADCVCGYLQTRLEGDALHQQPQTPRLIFKTGAALARLDQALGRTEVPAARRPVLWNISCWPHLSDFAPHLPPGPLSDHVRRAMSDYADRIAPRLSDLDWQVTHNDPSPHNMLLTPAGPGFIDFGDGGWNPRLQDLAIAAGHMVTDSTQPLGGAAPLIAGYASVLPLSALETKLLVGLMRARQAALILINRWRSHLFPEEAAYINKNLARAERGLAILASLDDASGEAAVKAAAMLPRPPSQLN